MSETTNRTALRRAVKVKTLLAATAGAAVVVLGACGGFTSGNLVAPPPCGADAGPPGCFDTTPQDSGSGDGGSGDGGIGGDQ